MGVMDSSDPVSGSWRLTEYLQVRFNLFSMGARDPSGAVSGSNFLAAAGQKSSFLTIKLKTIKNGGVIFKQTSILRHMPMISSIDTVRQIRWRATTNSSVCSTCISQAVPNCYL
jgi:hypothetical protein